MYCAAYFLLQDHFYYTVVLVVIGSISVLNGANYYIEYFSRKYDLHLNEIEGLAKEVYGNYQKEWNDKTEKE